MTNLGYYMKPHNAMLIGKAGYHVMAMLGDVVIIKTVTRIPIYRKTKHCEKVWRGLIGKREAHYNVALKHFGGLKQRLTERAIPQSMEFGTIR